MISVKSCPFLLKYTILMLLTLPVIFFLNQEAANADKISRLTSKLKQLEKELETTSKAISNALKNKNEKELANLDSRLNDLNLKVDDLKRSVDELRGVEGKGELSDRAQNLWQGVQNLRGD